MFGALRVNLNFGIGAVPWLSDITSYDFLFRVPCYNMSLFVRKPAFCICENKNTDQLCGDREADQLLCFCYTDSKIPLLPKSEISSL